jgi:hypothetical protein
MVLADTFQSLDIEMCMSSQPRRLHVIHFGNNRSKSMNASEKRSVAAFVLAVTIILSGLVSSGPLYAAGSLVGVTTSGEVTVISPPASTAPGANPNGCTLPSTTGAGFTLFAEKTGVALASPLAVDISKPGTYTTVADLTPGTVAATTRVDSYFLNSDGQQCPNPTNYDATITFAAPVLGVILENPTLAASNGAVGATGTAYSNAPGIGYELTGPEGAACAPGFGSGTGPGSGGDCVSLSPDGHTLTVHSTLHSLADQLRIVTAACDKPGNGFGDPNHVHCGPPGQQR